MASVPDLARAEGRGSGTENEIVQLGRSAALGLELGRRRQGFEAERIGGIRPSRRAKNPSFSGVAAFGRKPDYCGGLPSRRYTNLPGFKMPCGSSAALMVRCSFCDSLETACGHQRFLARPMPCSPVMLPPEAITQRNSSSRQASARIFAPGKL